MDAEFRWRRAPLVWDCSYVLWFPVRAAGSWVDFRATAPCSFLTDGRERRRRWIPESSASRIQGAPAWWLEMGAPIRDSHLCTRNLEVRELFGCMLYQLRVGPEPWYIVRGLTMLSTQFYLISIFTAYRTETQIILFNMAFWFRINFMKTCTNITWSFFI